MRRHSIALTSVEVQDFHCKAGSLNNPINQSLEPNFINLRFDGLDSCCTILIQGNSNKRLIPLRIQLHPGTCKQLYTLERKVIVSC